MLKSMLKLFDHILDKTKTDWRYDVGLGLAVLSVIVSISFLIAWFLANAIIDAMGIK